MKIVLKERKYTKTMITFRQFFILRLNTFKMYNFFFLEP